MGALNVAYLAANATESLESLVDSGISLWRNLRYGQVLKPLVSWPEAARLGSYLGEVLGVRGVRAASLLDPGPLTETLKGAIDFGQIHRNVRRGAVEAAAVVATSAATNLSVVFHDGGPNPPSDHRRGIDYVRAILTEDHVRASAAIPMLFPAVPLGTGGRRHWYFDGGTRLNTPIKPALELGAERVIVIALNSLARRPPRRESHPPDALDGSAQLIQAVLVDPLVHDVHTLATINALLRDSSAARVQANEQRTGRRRIPYMLIAPEDPDEVGRAATEVYRRHYGSTVDLARSPNVAALGRLLGAGTSPGHGELLSYLFFAEEFAEALIELGRRDATSWLRDSTHDDGLWQVGPLA